MDDATYTEFMIRAMEGEDEVSSAILIVRRNDETIGYKVFNQQMADSLGLLRFAQLSVENDLVSAWRND